MPILHVLAGGVIAGIAATVTGYAITGRLFHPYQAKTPQTWRQAETWTHYLYATAVRIAACIGMGFSYAALTAALTFLPPHAMLRGLAFGSMLWAVTIMPLVLELALFINLHCGFVVGLLLDWLAVCVLAGVSAAVAVGRV